MVITREGQSTLILDPVEEGRVRDILSNESEPGFELAYQFDSWISDVETHVFIKVLDEHDRVIFEDEL